MRQKRFVLMELFPTLQRRHHGRVAAFREKSYVLANCDDCAPTHHQANISRTRRDADDDNDPTRARVLPRQNF